MLFCMSILLLSKSKHPNTFRIMKGRQLLKPHRSSIAEIRAMVGISKRLWEALYFETLINLAQYIQGLPASEAHHHSDRGGLLTHTIDTATQALRIRRGKLLPPNSDAEVVTKYKDVWTYAVFTASLCHDLAKPITDMSVELLDKNKTLLGRWSPFKGPMTINNTAREYRIQYRRNRNYASHERASALYVHHIVPTIGLEWLSSYSSEAFFYWTNYLTGHSEDTGALGIIVHEADKRSVASNLAGDQVSKVLATPTNRKPLHQRLLTSLRYQIDEGLLPLNRDGAAGWVVGDRLWVVVKRALDQVRDHMTQEGQTGIPARNDRLMDELQQYNVLIPNGDKAVWKCQVFAPEWAKAHELTLLCLPTEKVWPAEDAIPGKFNGTVTPLDSIAEVSATSEQPDAQEVRQKKPANVEAEQVIEQTDICEKPELQPPANDLAIPVSTDSLSVTAINNQRPSPELSGNTNAGNEFLAWLRDGLHERKFKVNDVNSRIHMTREGLFLVSPVIFREFDQNKWSYVQKRFTKLKLHERNSNGTNIHEYLATGKKKKSLIKGFLITDTANVFPGIELPNINHNLSKA